MYTKNTKYTVGARKEADCDKNEFSPLVSCTVFSKTTPLLFQKI